MVKTMKKLVCTIAAAVISMSLAACSSNTAHKSVDSKAAQPKKEIKIACTESSEPRVIWLREGLESLGYDVKAVLFDANQLPATALKDGDVDGMMSNQLPWVKVFNKEKNCDLRMVEPYSYYSRNAIYSTKYKTLNELPQNAQIAVPADPANLERGLVVLRDVGLITLGEKTGNFFTVVDIKDNPKNIKIIETQRGMTARSINDVDAIFALAHEVKRAGYDPNVFLYEEPNAKNYPHGLVVNGKDIDAGWVKDAIKVIQSDEYRKKFNDYHNGVHILFDK